MTEQLLVSTDWLHEHLNDPTMRIVDIRGQVISATLPPPHYFNHRADYDKAHIPNAVFVDWDARLPTPPTRATRRSPNLSATRRL